MSAIFPRDFLTALPGSYGGDTLVTSMAEPSEPLLQDCLKCGTPIDVTNEEPFARMHCPSCGESLRVRRQFDHFEIQEALGSGGMGTVYRAMDHNLHRSVALKLLRKDLSSDPEFIRQFEHEAAITALITHPNVVKVYSTGSDRGLFFIAMELVDKGSLDDLMTDEGTVPELRCLELGIQIAHGLLAALKCGLIHRDVKPGNILFADARNSKIVDFGLAVPMDQAGTVGGEIWGTPYYVAPEKLANRPEDFRSDMYSLAASLYHAITGEPPCETEEATINTLLRLKQTLRPIEKVAPGVASETAYVINRALNFEPNERYQSYEDFIEHLEYARNIVAKRERAAAKAARQVPTAKAETRRTASWMTLGIVAAVALSGTGIYQFRDVLFGPKNTAAIVQPTGTPVMTAQETYDSGRVLLSEGKFDEAAAVFLKVESDPRAGHPLKDWAAIHLALSHLLRGNREEAAGIFQRLADSKPYSHEPGKAVLASFFVDASAQLAPDAPLPVALSVSADAAAGNHRAILPLLWGAKAWSRGEMDAAAKLFQQSPGPEAATAPQWIAAYQPLASRLSNDATEYQEIATIWTSALTEQSREEALPKLKAAVASTQLTGWPKTLLAKLVEEASTMVAATKAKNERLAEEQWAKDRLVLEQTRKATDVLLLQWKFEDAHAALMLIQPSSEKGRREKQLLLKRAEWLASFKKDIISNMGSRGYSGPITSRAGTKIDGVVVRATLSGLQMKTNFGGGVAEYSNVSLETPYTIAQSLLARDEQQGITANSAERRWHLGIYALFIGKPAEGKAFLGQAVRMKPAYAKEVADALAAFGLSEGTATSPAPSR